MGNGAELAGALLGLKVRVYMARASYQQKPYRKTIMRLYGGAEIYPSPSDRTEVGRRFLAEDPNHPGGLGIAISEAIEDVLRDENARYALGSVLNHVLMHQTVIGLEAKEQMKEFEEPDVIIGCVGGGSNFAGLSYPFVRDVLNGKADYEFIAVEPRAAPSMTRGGVYMYDFGGDSGGYTPKMRMHTLGHTYYVPPIHAGGLRYHGLAPTLSVLINHGGVVRPVAYHQNEVFKAAELFARTEGIIPAPESSHAIKGVIDRAWRQRGRGGRRRPYSSTSAATACSTSVDTRTTSTENSRTTSQRAFRRWTGEFARPVYPFHPTGFDVISPAREDPPRVEVQARLRLGHPPHTEVYPELMRSRGERTSHLVSAELVMNLGTEYLSTSRHAFAMKRRSWTLS